MDIGSWADAMSNDRDVPQLQQGQDSKEGHFAPQMTSFDADADGIVDYGPSSNSDASTANFLAGSGPGLTFSSPKAVSSFVDDVGIWDKDTGLHDAPSAAMAASAAAFRNHNSTDSTTFTTSPDESIAGGPTLTSPSDDVASFRSSPSYNTADGFSSSTRTHSIDGTSVHSSFDQHKRTSSMSSSSSHYPDYNAAAAAAAAAAWNGASPALASNVVPDQGFAAAAAAAAAGALGVGVGSGGPAVGAGGYYNVGGAPSAFRPGSASDTSLTPFGGAARINSMAPMTSEQAAAMASLAAAQQGSQAMGPPIAMHPPPPSLAPPASTTAPTAANAISAKSSNNNNININHSNSNGSSNNKRGQTSDGTKSSSSSSAGAGTTRRTKFRRSRTGCMVCRKRKVKCDQDGQPCKQCRIGKRDCHYEEAPQKRRRKTRTDGEGQSTASRSDAGETEGLGTGQKRTAAGQAEASTGKINEERGLPEAQQAAAAAVAEMPMFAHSLYSSTSSLLPAPPPTSMGTSSSSPTSAETRGGVGVSATLAPAVGNVLAHSSNSDATAVGNSSMSNNDLPSGVVAANAAEDAILGPFSAAYSPSVDDGADSWPPDDWSTALDGASEMKKESANDERGAGLFEGPIASASEDKQGSMTTSSTQSLDEPVEGDDGLRLSEPPSSTLKASAGEEGVPLYDEHSPSTYLTSTSSSEWGLGQEVSV